MTSARRAAWYGLPVLLLVAVAWYAWIYYQFRTCSTRMCPVSATEPPIILASGASVPVIALHLSSDGSGMLDYVTAVDSKSMPELCAEARAVWSAVRTWPRLAGLSSLHLGPTRQRGEFIGMRWGVVPQYWCCSGTYLTVKRSSTGEWRFRQATCNVESQR